MMKGSGIFIFISALILNLILTCSSLRVKYPAKVSIKQTRSTEGGYDVQIEANGEIRQLLLNTMENIWSDVAQGLHITQDENDEQILERKNVPQDLIKVYHDSEKGSIVSVKDGKVNGILDSDYAVKCEGAEHFIMKFDKKDGGVIDYISIPDDTSAINDGQNVKEDINNLIKKKMPKVVPLTSKISDNIKNTYTVEIAVIVDSTLANLIGTDSEIYEYLAIFWNSVKKRYETIQSPTIIITLVGAVIIRDTSAEPFFRNNIEKDNTVLGNETLYDLSDWVYKRFAILPDHDIIYLQTGKDIYRKESLINLAGISFHYSACQKYNVDLRSYSVAFGEDKDAFFDGVHTATHEIAHNLGAGHDNNEDAGTSTCNLEDGYIMSAIVGQKNYYTFSNCSIDNITTYLDSGHAECLKTNTASVKPPGLFNTTLLPGDILSMTEQCKFILADNTAEIYTEVDNEDSLCYNLQCLHFVDEVAHLEPTFKPAAEGSECPSGKRCFNGICA